MTRKRRSLLILLVLSLLLAGTGAVLVWPRFDGLYGQDSFAYYGYARGPLAEALRQGQLPPPFFWPPGFPLLAWLALRLLGNGPRAGQVVALLAGALVPLFAALLAAELFPSDGRKQQGGPREEGRLSWVPLLAGLLVALQGQLWQSSVVIMSDTPALTAGTAGMWLVARWGRNGRRPALCLGAGLLAYAILTRWAYGLVAIAATIYALYRLVVMGRKGARTAPAGRPARHHPWRQAVAAGLVVLLVLAPVWLPVASDLLTGKRAEEVAFAGDLAVYRWSPLNALRRTFTTSDGQLNYRLPNGLYYALAPAHRYFFTPLLALLLLPGLWQLWRLRTAARLWLVAGWAGVTLAFHAGAPWQNFRFTLVYLPPLAIIAALGISASWQWFGQQAPARRPARLLFATLLLAGLAQMVWGGVTLTSFFVERKQADLATVAWVEAQTPPDAQLLAFNMTFTLEEYGSHPVAHLFYHTPETVAALVASGRPLFLLLEVDSFGTQWAGHRSEQAFRWLQAEPGLLLLGQDRQYYLYRVGGT